MKLLGFPDPAMFIACALNVLIGLTVLSLIALFAARFVFRHSPALRYAVCLAALTVALFSPLVTGAGYRAGGGVIHLSLPRSLFDAPPPGESTQETGSRRVDLPAPRLSMWVQAMLTLWMAGCLWGFVRFVRGWRIANQLIRAAQPWQAAAHDAVRDSVERALGRRLPPILTTPGIISPFATGLLHPVVILPEGLPETLSPTQLRHILLHECGHITLRHALGGLVERMVGILFWVHPLVRPLCRELAQAREDICDNVASQEDGAACYARTLLAIAQGISNAPNLASTLALLGPETSLESRIAGLLNPRRDQMVRVKRWKLWAVTSAALCALALAGTVRVVQANEPSNTSSKPTGVVVHRVGNDLFVATADGKRTGPIHYKLALVSHDQAHFVPDGQPYTPAPVSQGQAHFVPDNHPIQYKLAPVSQDQARIIADK
jgi:beta-lactamase regulating signal transducer with metallopeptidase domain